MLGSILDLVVVSISFVWLATLWARKQKRGKLPPGPVGYPFIGNLLDLPREKPWLRYAEWGALYRSDVVHLDLLGSHIIVLNSAEAVHDLLMMRSSIYSDRPQAFMIHETSWVRNFGFCEYGDQWRMHHRLFRQHYNEKAMVQYQAKVVQYPRRLLRWILEQPDGFLRHFRRMPGSMIIDITYGFDVRSEDDPWLTAAENAVESINAIGNPGSFLVDVFPILQYLPSWFPGASFKRSAALWKETVEAMFEEPMNAVRKQMASSAGNDSIAAKMLAQMGTDEDGEEEYTIKNVAGTAFSGGEDTTTGVLQAFCLIMLTHPEIQDVAYAEIIRVLGHNRFPELDDRDLLPFVSAIMWEVMRWQPIAPLAIPHRVMADDEYKGFHIPAGSTVVGNVWAILHDPTVYPNPNTFDPRRFLTSDGQVDPAVPKPDAIFGFGRRACPGKHFAYQMLWATMAHILTVFRIEKPVDADGTVVGPSGVYGEGLITYPAPFRAEFKPRSPGSEKLIRSWVE